MLRKLFFRWQTNKAFEALFTVGGEYSQDSEEYKQMVTVLDILRTRM